MIIMVEALKLGSSRYDLEFAFVPFTAVDSIVAVVAHLNTGFTADLVIYELDFFSNVKFVIWLH
ncbi:MAG: hypothetical protein BRD24_04740 [Halobacteriales archaeon SW_9_67_24]|nr:MAG: hypothetical protein BRD24_04740 [Halobacteriales archaeon SW_9_67_24]